MTSISSSSDAATLILQQAAASATSTDTKGAPADALLAIVNGNSAQATTAVSAQPSQAQAKIADAMFSVNSPNINKQKLDLMDRTAAALGVDKDDYASQSDYGQAVLAAFTKLQSQPDGAAAIHGIEKQVGLDKLGVSLETVVDAIVNSDGKANEELTKALEKKAGMLDRSQSTGEYQLIVQSDDSGAYGVAAS